MSDYERQRRHELEREADEIKAQVLVIWGRISRLSKDIALLQDQENERQSQTAIDRYREELPSETKFSLNPTGMRILFKNNKPSAWLLLVIVVVVGGVVALALLLRSR
jgi:hypothetical protein